MKAKRQSNLELLRIISMLMVIAFHFFCFADDQWTAICGVKTFHGLLEGLLGVWGKTAINVFVIISCWFLCVHSASRFHFMGRLVKLYLTIAIYGAFTCCVRYLLSGQFVFPLGALFPVDFQGRYFAASFFTFMLVLPFLREFVSRASRNCHLALVVLIMIFMVFLPSVHVFVLGRRCNYVVWFSSLFVITSFLRRFCQGLSCNSGLRKKFCVAFLLCVSLSIASVFCLGVLGWYPLWFLDDSNKIMSVCVAFSVFFLFYTIDIPYTTWVNRLASHSFDILLYHAGVLAPFIWNDMLMVKYQMTVGGVFFLFSFVFSVLAVYSIGVALGEMRHRITNPLLKLIKI